MKPVYLAALAVALFGGIGAIAYTRMPAPPDPVGNFYAACDREITGRLKSPSSYVRITKDAPDRRRAEGGDALHMRISYDAQNSFGALIRAQSECVVIVPTGKDAGLFEGDVTIDGQPGLLAP